MDLAEISHLPFFVVGLCVDFFFLPISGLAPHTAGTKSLAGTVGGMGGSKLAALP